MPKNLKPRLTNVLAKHTGKVVRNFGVASPGIVTRAYNNLAGTTFAVDVQPAVNRLLPTEDDEDVDSTETYAVQRYVPVCWLVGTNVQVRGKLAVGSTVALLVMDRGIGRWRASGAISDPDDARQHDYSSCVAIPGLVPSTSPFTAPSDAAALASKLDAFLATVGALTEATDLASALTAINSVLAAAQPYAPVLVGGGGLTTASTVLLLEE
jgi:hypothetical protein